MNSYLKNNIINNLFICIKKLKKALLCYIATKNSKKKVKIYFYFSTRSTQIRG